MAVKFEQRMLKTLPLSEDGTRARYADAVVQGLHIDVLPPASPGGPLRRSWRLRYRTLTGERKWIQVGTWPATSVDDARSEVRRIIGEVEKGCRPSRRAIREESRSHPPRPLGAVPGAARPTPPGKTLKGYKAQYRTYIDKPFGSLKVQAPTREAIVRWHRQISQTAPTSAKYALRVLSTMLARAEEWGYLPPGTNPAKQVRQNKANKKHRPLTTEEANRVGKAITQMAGAGKLSEQVAAGLRLLLLTGCRRGEIAGLGWSSGDLKTGSITFDDHKTVEHLGDKRDFLRPAAVKILLELAGFCLSAFVFPDLKDGCPMSPETLTQGWLRVRMEAGILDARLHDLRHTVDARAGAILPAFMVQTNLGHK